VDEEEIHSQLKQEFLQTMDYQNKVKQPLKITLPAIGNTTFANINYNKLKAFHKSVEVNYKPSRWHSPFNGFSTSFLSPEKNSE